MKKSKTFRPVHQLLLLAGCISFATAAPYGPDGRETSWTQPNGQVIPLKVFGDEYHARTETADGHTLIFSDKDNTYYYAKLSADGKSLVSTGIPAGEGAPADLPTHLDLPKESIVAEAKAAHEKYDGERNERWNKRVQAVRKIKNAANGAELRGIEAANAKIQAAPVIGDIVGLTILVQFPNDPATPGADPVTFPTNQAKIERFCNGVGYTEDGNTGSVRDYYSDQSLGVLNYTQKVTTVVTLPHPRNYYNYSDYPANTNLYVNVDESASNMIDDAVTILKNQGFDFNGLTVDTGGQALATNVFFAGPDSGRFARGLWPHQFHVDRTITVGTGGNITLYNYQITNIPDSRPVIGTFCHENGHLILDYPDIYSLDGEGVGEHCLMGSGNYLNGGKTPSPINGYFKDLVGWGNVTDLAPDEFLTTQLPSTGNVGYRVYNPTVSTEFFFVENRGKGDKWARYSDDTGIAIWHVDETIDGNTRGGPHYGVALEQADGRQDLENGRNRGDASDLFDLGDAKFTNTTNPNSLWWDGSKSFVDIEVISDIGANTTVAFGGVPPDTIIVSTPNGGEVVFKDSKYPITWKSNITGNVSIDLYKAGKLFLPIAISEPDNGNYEWSVPAKLAPSDDYTIVISSVSNPTPVSDTSDARFSVTDATFPPANEIPYGWFKPSFAATRWEVTKQVQFEGKSSLRSGKTGDGKTSGIGYRSNFNAGTVSFYVKVSSEAGFDFTRFYIDGVAQPFTAGGSSKGLSGNQNWRFVQFPVSAGSHVFVWTYEKDSSFAGLQDTAWIDGVTLPTSTQEISVQEPKGTELVDGNTTKTFPDVPVGETSKAMVFTIKNSGKADLVGLGIKKVGSNSTEFTVSGLNKSVLSPGQSTSFEVIFTPKDYGLRTAGIRIISNDLDESNFAISLQGTGIGQPEIGINQPTTKPMKDGDSRSFGIANVGSTGNVKTFTIINNGASVLNQLQVTKKGANKSEFLVGPLGVISLDPGDSTTFTVTFSPKGANVRSAVLRIDSNDEKSGPFEIMVSGKGSPVAFAANSLSSPTNLVEAVFGASTPSSVTAPTTAVEVIGGRKYLSLTVTKLPGDAPVGTVEVSANLLDWYSGTNHTTTLIDNASILKVRDNTPVTQGAKRYIRLK